VVSVVGSRFETCSHGLSTEQSIAN
jgi:hypothetical protein